MTTTYADVHIKVDANVKVQSEKVLEQIGISMTDLINMTLRRVIRERRIPFSTKVDFDLPENFRIETKEQLLDILNNRILNDEYIDDEEFWNDFMKRHQLEKVGDRELKGV